MNKDKALDLYAQAESYYKRGRALLLTEVDIHNLEVVRLCAIRIGEYALKAKNKGLPREKYLLALKARDALLGAYNRALYAYQKRQNIS